MYELSAAFGQFMAGFIDLEQLRSAFREYLKVHPEQRAEVSLWLQTSVQSGRLPESVRLSLLDAIQGPAPVSNDSPAPAATSAERPGAAGPDAQTERRPSGDRPERAVAPVLGLHPGTVVKERFVLVAELGRGGMGQVFKARDLLREQAHDRQPFVALKFLSPEFSAHPDSFIALQREARRAGTLAHPNVVYVQDFDRDGDRTYMVMEFLEGRPLDAFLSSDWAGGLGLAKVWPIVRDIGAALEYGHSKRIVHSDLKPGNIFICNDGTVKVLDFGISRLIRSVDGEETLFDADKRLGALTPAYASLEMWNHEAPDPRDDIYALACVTHELLTGQHPFARASAKQALNSELEPHRVEALNRSQWEGLRRGLALRREDRTPSVGEFARAFAPPSRLRRFALPATVAAVAVGAATLFVSARYYRAAVEDSTVEVMRCAGIPRPAPSLAVGEPVALTAQQEQEITDDLALAVSYLHDVTPATSVEYLRANLSEGANSVNDILDKVLSLDPRQRDALRLKEEVADLYASRAQKLLDDGQIDVALELVRNGRIVRPSSQKLFRLEQTICRADAAAKAAESAPVR